MGKRFANAAANDSTDAMANDGTDATANGRKGLAKDRVTTPQVLPRGGPGAGAGTATVIRMPFP